MSVMDFDHDDLAEAFECGRAVQLLTDLSAEFSGPLRTAIEGLLVRGSPDIAQELLNIELEQVAHQLHSTDNPDAVLCWRIDSLRAILAALEGTNLDFPTIACAGRIIFGDEGDDHREKWASLGAWKPPAELTQQP